MKTNGKDVTVIRQNGVEFSRVMRNGVELWNGTGLPSGYTLLEYIESSGSSYIDTGFKHNNNTRVVMDVEPTSITANAWIFEGRASVSTGVGNHGVFFWAGSTKTWTSDYNSSRLNTGVGDVGRLLVDYNKNICTINNVSVTHDISEYQSTSNLGLLCSINGSTPEGFVNAKLYYCQIYDNDVLIRDYVPCMNASGVCGLFDKVNKVFYPSASSTAFTGEYYEDIEYIESSGTQYIDTGFVPNQDTRVVMEGAYSFTANGSLFGVRTSSSSNLYTMTYVYSSVNFLSNYGTGYVNISAASNTEFVLDKNKNITTFNGTVYTDSYESFTCPSNLYLFATNGNGTLLHYSSLKMRSCQIYDNGILVRDFIPVKGMISGIYGLYDKVNGVFYPSASSTGFTGA